VQPHRTRSFKLSTDAFNLSSDKTKAVEQFLQQNPQVHFHFTPTYSSWLNQV
jgi:transposase